jgi:hypothetical protein
MISVTHNELIVCSVYTAFFLSESQRTNPIHLVDSATYMIEIPIISQEKSFSLNIPHRVDGTNPERLVAICPTPITRHVDPLPQLVQCTTSLRREDSTPH